MKADKCISDVVGALQVEDQPCRRVQHRLESAQEIDWDADQHAVAVVQPGVHQGDDQCLERGRRHTPTVQVYKKFWYNNFTVWDTYDHF